jgi:small subunit ribosomal protein S2
MIKEKSQTIDKMFKVGAHFGLSRSRRHPTTAPYVFGVKNRIEIFDLEKTEEALAKAVEFVKSVAASGKQILIVSGKSEAIEAVKLAAGKIGQPNVPGRWIGGTLTNFVQIRKRVEKLETRLKEKEKGELVKYTKKERLLIDREIANLERFFAGIVSMKEKPGALVVVDPKREEIAVLEALQLGVPVIAIASTDCNLSNIKYPIPANDSSAQSVSFFLNAIADAYAEGKTLKPKTETK